MWLTGGLAAWWDVTLGALALALPLAWLSWHGIEKRALRWVRSGRRSRVAASALPDAASGS
jgi:peptidoglycan/LPS O-acetylase OafA/YrhL